MYSKLLDLTQVIKGKLDWNSFLVVIGLYKYTYEITSLFIYQPVRSNTRFGQQQ